MDSTLFLQWSFSDKKQITVIHRYCANCSAKMPFADSGKRRRNAHGKDIIEYAIFKCPADHTWNKKVSEYKAFDRSIHDFQAHDPGAADLGGPKNEQIDLNECLKRGITRIEILVKYLDSPTRLDKLLARQVKNASRSQIARLIQKGAIVLDHAFAGKDSAVRSGHTIQWTLERY